MEFQGKVGHPRQQLRGRRIKEQYVAVAEAPRLSWITSACFGLLCMPTVRGIQWPEQCVLNDSRSGWLPDEVTLKLVSTQRHIPDTGSHDD